MEFLLLMMLGALAAGAGMWAMRGDKTGGSPGGGYAPPGSGGARSSPDLPRAGEVDQQPSVSGRRAGDPVILGDKFDSGSPAPGGGGGSGAGAPSAGGPSAKPASEKHDEGIEAPLEKLQGKEKPKPVEKKLPSPLPEGMKLPFEVDNLAPRSSRNAHHRRALQTAEALVKNNKLDEALSLYEHIHNRSEDEEFRSRIESNMETIKEWKEELYEEDGGGGDEGQGPGGGGGQPVKMLSDQNLALGQLAEGLKAISEGLAAQLHYSIMQQVTGGEAPDIPPFKPEDLKGASQPIVQVVTVPGGPSGYGGAPSTTGAPAQGSPPSAGAPVSVAPTSPAPAGTSVPGGSTVAAGGTIIAGGPVTVVQGSGDTGAPVESGAMPSSTEVPSSPAFSGPVFVPIQGAPSYQAEGPPPQGYISTPDNLKILDDLAELPLSVKGETAETGKELKKYSESKGLKKTGTLGFTVNETGDVVTEGWSDADFDEEWEKYKNLPLKDRRSGTDRRDQEGGSSMDRRRDRRREDRRKIDLFAERESFLEKLEQHKVNKKIWEEMQKNREHLEELEEEEAHEPVYSRELESVTETISGSIPPDFSEIMIEDARIETDREGPTSPLKQRVEFEEVSEEPILLDTEHVNVKETISIEGIGSTPDPSRVVEREVQKEEPEEVDEEPLRIESSYVEEIGPGSHREQEPLPSPVEEEELPGEPEEEEKEIEPFTLETGPVDMQDSAPERVILEESHLDQDMMVVEPLEIETDRVSIGTAMGHEDEEDDGREHEILPVYQAEEDLSLETVGLPEPMPVDETMSQDMSPYEMGSTGASEDDEEIELPDISPIEDEEEKPGPIQEIRGVLELKPPDEEDSPYLSLTYDFSRIPDSFKLSADYHTMEYAYYKYKPMLIKAQEFTRRKMLKNALNYYRVIKSQNIPPEFKRMINRNIQDITEYLEKYLMGR